MARLGIIATVLLVAGSSYATTIHVPAEQPTIQAGISAASTGDTVLVAQGTYYENLSLGSHNVVLASNYLVTGDTVFINSTIIDGNNAGKVITVDDGQDNTTKISGFTIRNGVGGLSAGGGVYCGNGSRPVIEHNIIEGNLGGGICAYAANPQIQYNIVRNNSGTEGGGIYCYGVSSTITNNLIVGNQASSGEQRGGGIFYYYSSCAIENNTIVNNSDSHGGGGIYYWADAGHAIRNNIIWSNSSGQIALGAGAGNPAVTYCDIQSGWSGTGNIASDPLFANPGEYDFRLQSVSPCINAGDPDPSYDDPDGSRNDMGAFPHYCCSGRVGNVDGFGTYPNEVTISDIQAVISVKFIWRIVPCTQRFPCLAEADVNQSGGANPICANITIADIQTLVNHLFICGPSNCPLKDCL